MDYIFYPWASPEALDLYFPIISIIILVLIVLFARKHIKNKKAVDHNKYLLYRLLPLLSGFIGLYVFWYILIPIICLLYVVSLVEMKKDKYIYTKKKISIAALYALLAPIIINSFLSIVTSEYLFFR